MIVTREPIDNFPYKYKQDPTKIAGHGFGRTREYNVTLIDQSNGQVTYADENLGKKEAIFRGLLPKGMLLRLD